MRKFFDYLNKRRLKIAKPFLKGDILDVGCGPATTYDFAKPKSYTGIERDKGWIKKLKNKFPLANFYARDIEKDKFNINRKFDTIILLAVIEHIKNPEFLFKEIRNSLKKNGRLVMTTPTPFGNFVHTILSYIGITSKEAVKEHVNIYSYNMFLDVASKYGFKLIKYQKFEWGCNSMVVLEKEIMK